LSEKFDEISGKILSVVDGFRFGTPDNYRDVALLGDCQFGVKEFARELGWKVRYHICTS
jgi:hypothetical protein